MSLLVYDPRGNQIKADAALSKTQHTKTVKERSKVTPVRPTTEWNNII